MTQRRAPNSDSFLSSLTVEQSSRLLAMSSEIEFTRDEIILRTAENSRWFYLLLTGSVAVEVVRASFSVCVQALGPGDAFGWSALLWGSDTLFQVRAREACRVACIDGRRLTALCRAEPEFGVTLLLRILAIVAARVHGTEARLAEFCGIAPDEHNGFAPLAELRPGAD